MAKKKNPAKLQVYLSEDNYLKSGKARNLSIKKCLINADWQDAGIASIVVVRQHINGNITVGMYMADLFCVGVKSTHFYFNISEDEFSNLAQLMAKNYQITECDYSLAHNIIYGSVAFAQDYEIPPHKDFNLTKMILEEDDDDVPLVDIEFGREGMPFLISNSDDPKMKFYHSQLLKYAGEGNFHYITEVAQEELHDESKPDFWEKKDWNLFFEDLDGCKDEEELLYKMLDSFESVHYIFEKTLSRPTVEQKKLSTPNFSTKMDLVYEPLSLINYKESDEENKEIDSYNKALANLQTSNFRTKSKAKKLAINLKKATVKWPNNPIFLNYLFSAYQFSRDFSASKEIAKLTVELFPSYLFGKIVYAKLMIQDGELDQVPELFNNKYNLKAIYPDRKKFHVQEYLELNILWCEYFLEKGDLYLANLHYGMNTKIDVPEEMMMNEEIVFKLHVKICKYVEDLVLSKNTQFTREELIKTLIN